MALYLIIQITAISDQSRYQEYCRKAKPIVESFGGRYLANTKAITQLAGDWQPEKIVLLEFASQQQLAECFGSEAYKAIAPLRLQSTKGHAIIVNGTID